MLFIKNVMGEEYMKNEWKIKKEKSKFKKKQKKMLI